MSKEGCVALKDCGVKAIWCSAGKRYEYNGDRTVLPYGHGMRIENFRKPETAMYWRPGGGDDISVSACGYNHLLPEQVKITREVERFAGPGMFAKAVTPHWGPMSKEGCLALRDCGVKAIWCSSGKRYEYTGDRTVLPYGHGMRIENFRKPETAMYWRAGGGDDISVSACGYNHLLPEQVKVTHGTYNWLHDRATGCNFMTFGCGAPCLNLWRLEDIPARMANAIGKEFLIHATHEEYWFKDYFAYQPDSREKLLTAVKAVHDAGYQYAFIEDKIDW
jgi:hypothetical protein